MESRKRLRPWLWNHTDAEDYGLKWVNKEEGLFRIPWIHRSSRDWNQDHCRVFKEWAKFTNRYNENEGEKEDYPGWKTRLRTALTKLSKDFEEISDMHKLEDVVNPYKVYRFKTIDHQRDVVDSLSSPGYSPKSSQSTDGCQSSPSYSPPCPNYHQSASPGKSIAGNIPNIIDSNMSLCDNGIDALICRGESNEDGLFTDYQQNSRNIMSDDLPSDLQSLDCDNLIIKLPLSEINNCIADTNLKLDGIPQNPQPVGQPYYKTPKISYKIFYLDEIVKEDYLYDESYHFYFGQIPDVDVSSIVFGPKDSERIEFPDVTEMKRSINSEQQRLMQDILMKMDRGFLLKCDKGDIWAQRLCRTRIYATNQMISPNQLLDRKSKDPSKVFDLAYFKKHHLGDDRRSPVTHLTLAQEYRSNLLNTLLMHIELTSLEAENLLANNSNNSLQISDLNSGDQELQHQMQLLNIGAARMNEN